ncbi:MAG: hypothetical protein QOF48_2945 [Verrucomicrobiota bacterium]
MKFESSSPRWQSKRGSTSQCPQDHFARIAFEDPGIFRCRHECIFKGQAGQ